MRNILIFSIVYYPRFVGGAEVAIKEITDRINPEDIQFHMVTLRVHRDLVVYEKIGNVHVHRVGFVSSKESNSYFSRVLLSLNKYTFPFVACVAALRLHKKYSFDVTWSMMANYAGFTGLFFSILKPRIKRVLSLQEGDPIEYIKRKVFFVYPLFVQIFKQADRIQTISTYLATFARSMGYTKELVVVPNGADIALFSAAPNEDLCKALKAQYNKQEGDVFIVTTSRLVVKNGISDVISALALLPAHIKFLIIGVGELESRIRQQVHDLSLEDRVILAGFVQYKDLPAYLHISDIFIRPSLSEGMGNSFIEAMAAKIPVIATPVGGIPDFLFDRQTGVFCKVQDLSLIHI